jgi:hypothetical protein
MLWNDIPMKHHSDVMWGHPNYFHIYAMTTHNIRVILHRNVIPKNGIMFDNDIRSLFHALE